MQQSVQSCKMSYLLHRTNLSNQILPHECVNCDKFKTWIEWNWDRWLLHGENSIKYGWFKDKTTSKLIEFTQKLLHFTKLRGLFYLNLLPQPFNIFTQIYLKFCISGCWLVLQEMVSCRNFSVTGTADNWAKGFTLARLTCSPPKIKPLGDFQWEDSLPFASKRHP